ncbi:TPR repeat-containing CheR-type MCP methyltransferase [Leptolyngbya sp. NIES-3755]|nr:TPR repeat-containing CheR-type MCP methyltransferase [Leptolyngbya sp. NIES-3755]
MSISAIATLLSQTMGIDVEVIGTRKLTRAISTQWNSTDFDAYFSVLKTSPQALEALIEQIVVPETYFFRDRKPFEFLIEQVRSRESIRVLSAPCSTGEEPYSIAISLIEAGLSIEQFSIDAIDISQVAITKAKRGIYGKNSFRGEAWIDRDRYFRSTQDGDEIAPTLRKTVNFRQANLLTAFSVAQPAYDVIFCRNLLIYLDRAACTQVFNTLEQLLLPNGLLFVGASETAKVPGGKFTSVRQPFTFAFQKSTKPSVSNYREVPPDLPQTIPKSRVRSKPKKQPLTNLELARQLADMGQIEAAIAQCQAHLQQDCTNPDVYNLLGTLHQVKAEIIHAERYFQKALYLNPNHYNALLSLALLKEGRGDLQGAKLLQQRIQNLKP